MTFRLFHFSERDSIEQFVPRPVKVPSRRSVGLEWLNGPLVWAIDQWHQPMYLFPRDCPRILLWRNANTEAEDAKQYFDGSKARIIAYIEESWLSKVETEILVRYELPLFSFKSIDDAGMWVSGTIVTPIGKTSITNLPQKLKNEGVELRVLDSLIPLRDAWSSSLHISGIRLRNASGWVS